MMKRASQQRRGVITLEAILSIPLLVISFFAVAEFGILLIVQQAVTTAAIEGARESAKGATFAEVKTRVNEVLSVHSMSVTDANIRMERFDGGLTVDPAVPTCAPPLSTPALADGQTRVTLCFALPTGPIQNFLSTFGFTLLGKNFNISGYADLE